MNALIQNALREGRNLYEYESMRLFSEYDIPVPVFQVTHTWQETLTAAGEIGYPVTMKVVSGDILHKSDVGGVINQIMSEEQLAEAWKKMEEDLKKNAPDARIEGFLVTAFSPGGTECIAGMTRDEQFGTAVMFGLGGIFVEVLQDTALQLLPLTHEEAMEMISSIKGAKLLCGYRGQPACDQEAIAQLLLKLARLSEENPEISEIDINPFFAREDGVLAVDARILLKREK